MEKNFIIVVVIVLAVLALGGYLLFATNAVTPTENQQTNQTGNQPGQTQAKGSLYMTVTDAAVDMKTISAVQVTIDKVEVQSEAQGWVTVSTTPQTFELLELKAKDQAKLLVKTDVNAETYNQIRFNVSKVVVTESGQAKEAKVPSGVFRVNVNVPVKEDASTVVELDVLADVSLHKTGKGEFIFSPVLKITTQSEASVQVGANNVVAVSQSKSESVVNAGMDEKGQVRLNFMLTPDVDLNINAQGVIEL